ncbi:PREDICTED: probable serine/threonine-protein kinase At1g54610 [Nicotiana attenuata]|uniref:Serinethreonine-protein kinase n=1 Tax=Nicotiana attenuata TaxID=49451 RepID=A0A1J6IG64_NICAT|nr:PREDICTED: probable serine/threonine-protein kinase At1g54610 [Nicotiana attenuata]XP_019245981.1 PREDICTED: probable serine/threonine-protein kinase At1g54610 [Nicotiana attenuata]OIT03642.1 putative serinethreonine-protein kinase [Nicotiana attenuata]
MGCVASKQTVSVTPACDQYSGTLRENDDSDALVPEFDLKRGELSGLSGVASKLNESVKENSNGDQSVSLMKYVEGEQVAAGWPVWLSTVAAEAINGWLPLKPESFQKLDKIGQGTYSSVFRARDLESGRTVALKKVRFDNFEPESVRFMAREILILRRLDHPNIMKLEGIITSRFSSSIYLVFEYMEHDISGLLSCPEVKFSESQVKCLMKQLLSGLEHCHSRGIMHRDIKGANLLVNNEGILKVADFGLANFSDLGTKQPLTSRVVTLWYRPPELLLGATDYGASVDLWSVGCVFAEILTGKPILQGRTEVEQLHKVFKLCGSPPDDYWKRSKLPHATIFKPQHPYESCLWNTFKDLPKSAVSLIETLLSVEPHKRGTASSALASEYFKTKPHACDPSSLPKYPPSKEIDAKHHEDAKRKKPSGRVRVPDPTRKLTRKQNGLRKLAPEENLPIQNKGAHISDSNNVTAQEERDTITSLERPKPSVDMMVKTFHVKNASQGDVPFSGPLQISGSSGFAWAKRRFDDSSVRSRRRTSSRSLIFEPSITLHVKNNMEPKGQDNYELIDANQTNSMGQDTYKSTEHAIRQNWSQLERPDSFDASDGYHSQELSLTQYLKEETAINLVQDQGDKVEFSGPLLSQTQTFEELLEKHECQIRQAVRQSWFQRGLKVHQMFAT